ncbi:MAG: hypothetical protein HOK72_06555 [Flavobacteriales bacterium]|jgi:hypothetical protein|nr:hypothetical protein [Flavobacteriales bacterium]
MYKTIVNPETGRKVNVNGKIGQRVLTQYANQLGGLGRAKKGKVYKLSPACYKKQICKLSPGGCKGIPKKNGTNDPGKACWPQPGNAENAAEKTIPWIPGEESLRLFLREARSLEEARKNWEVWTNKKLRRCESKTFWTQAEAQRQGVIGWAHTNGRDPVKALTHQNFQSRDLCWLAD